MTSEALANWTYCEGFVPEDDILLDARDAAAEYGCTPVLPGSGALLTVLARILDARSIVEIGTGVGVSSLYLVRGMNPSGVLTTIDIEPEHHRIARETMKAAGVGSERVRMIAGGALTIIPRLTDGGYDLVFVDAVKSEYPAYVEHAVRLLRAGGVLAIDNTLWHSRVPDPAQRDHNTTAIRETLKAVKARDDLLSVLVPSGDGLLVAVRL
ncbi:MAG: O-methyltransferase [Demequinaceae bacterium]|nr:O-methyltransferase [Demequinaceae bacterium]